MGNCKVEIMNESDIIPLFVTAVVSITLLAALITYKLSRMVDKDRPGAMLKCPECSKWDSVWKSCEDKNNVSHMTCRNCGAVSQWRFDIAPVAIRITEENKDHLS
jgi:Zn ribbon nucleic-acid-binding protein